VPRPSHSRFYRPSSIGWWYRSLNCRWYLRWIYIYIYIYTQDHVYVWWRGNNLPWHATG
jgi:hypothetical protein